MVFTKDAHLLHLVEQLEQQLWCVAKLKDACKHHTNVSADKFVEILDHLLLNVCKQCFVRYEAINVDALITLCDYA